MGKIMDELWQEIHTAIEEAQAEFPETNPDDVAHEIVNGMTLGYSLAVRREMLRRAGFNPDW